MFCYDVIKMKYMMKSLGERKLTFIKSLSFYFLVFFIWQKFDTPNVNFYLPTKKRFIQIFTLSSTRQIRFVDFKKRFTQFCRNISCYADMLMMYINLLVHGHVQEFTKETVFCNCCWFCTDATRVGKRQMRMSNHNRNFSFKLQKQIFY